MRNAVYMVDYDLGPWPFCVDEAREVSSLPRSIGGNGVALAFGGWRGTEINHLRQFISTERE
jgi:hypothetical protein